MIDTDMEIKDLGHTGVVKAARLHEDSGFDYSFPRMVGNPLFPLQRGMFDGNDLVLGAALKVSAEVYLWLDHEWGTPQMRWDALRKLHQDVTDKARQIGFDQLYCVLPPEVAKSFGPRLEELGWQGTRPWPMYTIELRKG